MKSCMLLSIELKMLKKGEFFVARTLSPTDKRLKSDKSFLKFVEETF